ncbi:hypothetical protein Tco_1577199 [Tanacetum coccineum]
MIRGLRIKCCWFKLSSVKILHDEELAFLANPEFQKVQKPHRLSITHNAGYQADDLDAYDSDCDELNTAKVALMANLSHYGSDALVEAAVHNSNSSAQQDALILSKPTLSSRPTKVKVPKELPKVSMVNTSLKKLKHHLAGFDVSQEKDTVIMTLKERIKSLSGKIDENKIKKDLEEIETINIELDHRVTKLIAENEHLKQTYKQLYDSIKPARIRSKEQCADLINQVNLKSVEIFDLNDSLQEKVLVITALKDELRNLKGKALVDNDVTRHPTHSAYIKHTQEEAAVLRDLVDHIKANYPLDQALEYAYKCTKLIQELLTKISKTCPSINNSGEQLVAVTTKEQGQKRVKQSTSTSGSQSSGNTKKDKIRQTPSSTPDEEKKFKEKSLETNRKSVYKYWIHLETYWKPWKSKTNVPDSKSMVVQIVLWYLDFGCSKHMTGDHSQLTNFVNKFLGTVKFRNDHVAKILGYGDYQIGNVTISRVYYMEGLGHNLFSVGQFCD